MEQRADFITIATRDLDAAHRFYCDGLHWTPLLDVPGEILFFQVGHGVVLGLFDATKFADDLGDAAPPAVSGITLSNNVDGADAVQTAFDAAVAAGGSAVKTPRSAAFGGFHAHVADPNGLIWELAFNPGWSVADDGTVHLETIDPD